MEPLESECIGENFQFLSSIKFCLISTVVQVLEPPKRKDLKWKWKYIFGGGVAWYSKFQYKFFFLVCVGWISRFWIFCVGSHCLCHKYWSAGVIFLGSVTGNWIVSYFSFFWGDWEVETIRFCLISTSKLLCLVKILSEGRRQPVQKSWNSSNWDIIFTILLFKFVRSPFIMPMGWDFLCFHSFESFHFFYRNASDSVL